MNSMLSEIWVWTAAYEVLTTDKVEEDDGDAYGAFVNVVAVASSSTHFRELATAALEEDGYQILGMEDLQEIDLHNSGWPDDELELVMKDLSADNPVSYGRFNTYPKDGLDA